MRPIRYTLVTDGPSDRMLLPVLDWLLGQMGCCPQGEWFEPRPFVDPPRTLADRICRALEMFPCDVIFVHRDAERQPPRERHEEIREAARAAPAGNAYVYVVPVRMTEAWFLFDEAAIRRAAGVPDGRVSLDLPAVAKLETLPDPKRILHEALRTASGLSGRRLSRFKAMRAKHRLAEILADYSPLRVLPAFQELEADIAEFVAGGRPGVRLSPTS
ncbi:MAG: hypothetical protein GXP31_03090 [Kiritimatiellaeota bacterium]|nr:hypothetical protein [Kiritimatiellota bacterium]